MYLGIMYPIEDIAVSEKTIRRIIKDSVTKKLYGKRNSEICLIQQKEERECGTKGKNSVIINCLVTRKYFNTRST